MAGSRRLSRILTLSVRKYDCQRQLFLGVLEVTWNIRGGSPNQKIEFHSKEAMNRREEMGSSDYLLKEQRQQNIYQKP